MAIRHRIYAINALQDASLTAAYFALFAAQFGTVIQPLRKPQALVRAGHPITPCWIDR